MKITIRFFAMLREVVGTDSISLELSGSKPVFDVVKEIQVAFPGLEKYTSITSFAVNGEYAKRDVMLQDGDELALLPPISGG